MRFVNIDESMTVDIYAIEAIEIINEEMLVLFGLSGTEYQITLSDFNEQNEKEIKDITELKHFLLGCVAEG